MDRAEGQKILAEKRDLIRRAMAYRPGPDSCNSVYLGSMATAGLYHILGLAYGKPGFSDALEKADDATLDKLIEACGNVITYMEERPTAPCPCCGTVVPVESIRPSGVSVKPLEWVKDYSWNRADPDNGYLKDMWKAAAIGQTWAWAEELVAGGWVLLANGRTEFSSFKALSEFVQSEYERRILSTLQPPQVEATEDVTLAVLDDMDTELARSSSVIVVRPCASPDRLEKAPEPWEVAEQIAKAIEPDSRSKPARWVALQWAAQVARSLFPRPE